MITGRDLMLLNILVKDELENLADSEVSNNKVYRKKLKAIQDHLKSYKIKNVDHEIRTDIVTLISMKIETINIEIGDFENYILSILGPDEVEEGTDVKIVSDIDMKEELDDYVDLELSEDETRKVALCVIKREYEDIMMKFVS